MHLCFLLLAVDFPGSLHSICSWTLVPAHRHTSPPLQTLSAWALKDHCLSSQWKRLLAELEKLSRSFATLPFRPSFQVCILNFTALLSCFLYTNTC